MNDFIMGTVAMGSAIIGLYFLRFWVQTRDRLFIFFAFSFFLLALNRLMRTMLHDADEVHLTPYLIRLFAFIVILLAIVDKNLKHK